MPKTLRAVGACLVTSTFFGLSFIFIKMCVTEIPLFTMLAWRNIIALIAMTVCVMTGILKVNLKGKDLKPLLVLSLFQPILYYILEALGVKLTTASESGIIIACIPIMTMIFSIIFLKDKPTKLQRFFMVLTVAGAIIVAGIGGLQTSSNLLGYFILILAVCSDAAYSITSQKLKDFTSAEKTYAMCITGTVVFTVCALVDSGVNGTMKDLVTLPFTNMGFLACVLYLALGCNIIAFLCSNYAISIIGATRRSAFAAVSTVITVVAGVFYLHEPFSWLQALATVMILAGATGVNFAGRKDGGTEKLPDKK